MRFKPGDKVVCIHKGQWIGTNGDVGIGPEFNEIVEIKCACWAYTGNVFLTEYPYSTTGREQSFRSYWFEPLITDEQLEKELQSIPELV